MVRGYLTSIQLGVFSMRRCLQTSVALIALISALFITPANSQTWVPATSALAWNTYVAQVIPDGFNSIIGNGGTRLPNSGSVGQNTYGEYCHTIPLPMNFYFMNQQYAQGASVMISTNGYMTFANT